MLFARSAFPLIKMTFCHIYSSLISLNFSTGLNLICLHFLDVIMVVERRSKRNWAL
ncbi:hypothetical protein Ahy_A06g026159 isoform G [Arachis hypogaea]|uniref:Uncharacterized protein n=1 Tax=Arachis hypogaea TaxID=3818 RepID=A0A445CJL0_ARAHY|nr:hypothetical protein Ahy_A06g026159 isoform G [Arachis hypogaea]